jgi:tetratricopeptide (TPR) repeat protein
MDPDSVNARCNLANALCGSGYPKEGLKELNIGLELDPKSYPLLRTKIATLNVIGRTEEALQVNDEALTYFPGDKQLTTMRERLIEGPKPRVIRELK